MNKKPNFRKLKVYAFDPSLSLQINTALINETIFKIKWEELQLGPIGEYLIIIDYDPINKIFYEAVDLNDIYILAEDGLNPSESNPKFHQQMVYAIAMYTINNFEKALGRPALWSPIVTFDKEKRTDRFVKQLLIYPHAFRESNAYYSPAKKALLFGYFQNSNLNSNELLPYGNVFTCLSHDIIAHETTHALLDGIFKNFIEPTNYDTLAFHEAFSDIVALFQHFTVKEVLYNQIEKTKGDLNSENLLGQLAQQFGKAIGNYGSLRDAIGSLNLKTNKWEKAIPNPNDYLTSIEPHKRGSILVAAIFEAFTVIFHNRVKDLYRIASNGTGILPEGDLHPDLINRLSIEAAKVSSHILNMCIRALDYCPPIDITYGDYLRALITADVDLISDDEHNYRIAIIQAFRKRGIYPENVFSLSVDSLTYPVIDNNIKEIIEPLKYISNKLLTEYKNKISFTSDREQIFNLNQKFQEELHELLRDKFQFYNELEDLTKIHLTNRKKVKGIGKDKRNANLNKFEVHRIAYCNRISPNGNSINQIIINLVQKRTLNSKYNNMIFKGSCTLILDLNNSFNPDIPLLKYCITKSIDDIERIERQFKFQTDNNLSIREIYTNSSNYNANNSFDNNNILEPFCKIHNINS